MTIDQTSKALNLASDTVNATEKFIKALESLESLEAERAKAGLDLTTFDEDFATSSIKHVDGAALNAVLNTSIPAIRASIVAGNHDTNLQKVRP